MRRIISKLLLLNRPCWLYVNQGSKRLAKTYVCICPPPPPSAAVAAVAASASSVPPPVLAQSPKPGPKGRSKSQAVRAPAK